MARKKIIAGNWKMNMTPSEAVKLVETLKPLVVNDEVDVVFCVPAIDIIPVVEAAKGTNIQVGAENMYFEEKGAYTGEISPAMLVSDNCCLSLICCNTLESNFNLLTDEIHCHALFSLSKSFATAPDLFVQNDIDGGLVGGASLKADFGKIVNYK